MKKCQLPLDFLCRLHSFSINLFPIASLIPSNYALLGLPLFFLLVIQHSHSWYSVVLILLICPCQTSCLLCISSSTVTLIFFVSFLLFFYHFISDSISSWKSTGPSLCIYFYRCNSIFLFLCHFLCFTSVC